MSWFFQEHLDLCRLNLLVFDFQLLPNKFCKLFRCISTPSPGLARVHWPTFQSLTPRRWSVQRVGGETGMIHSIVHTVRICGQNPGPNFPNLADTKILSLYAVSDMLRYRYTLDLFPKSPKTHFPGNWIVVPGTHSHKFSVGWPGER